jgi:glycosyltransferase involved in cell wall biosynthesis
VLIKKVIENSYLDRVQFTGHLTRDTLVKLIQTADICVTPSLYENCPYSALEAMGCGRPVVASRNSGFVEMIKDGETGLLFEPGSAQDLADKILYLIRKPSLRQDLGRQAYQQVQTHYSAPVIAVEQINYYSRIIKQNKANGEQVLAK